MTPARRLAIGAPLILLATAIAEYAGGRSPICPCGHVALWHGAIDDENSQQILDWYSPSHLIHGLIFYALGWLILRRRARAIRLLVALAIEAGWELLENSPIIIDRYRTATIALGYTGDSILNSMSDIGCMAMGFWLASRVPAWASVTVAVAFELLTLAVIRDNLALNILMLAWPVEAVRRWQGG